MLSRLSKKSILIAISIIVLLSAAGFAYYQAKILPAQTNEDQQVQTTVVRQGDLAIYASGSGTLIALNEIELGFGASGPVEELYVQAGDQVQAGDLLAAQGDREQLEAAVASDQLSVMNAQQALDDLFENADVVAAQAQLELAEAMDQLHTAEYTWSVQQQGNRASQAMIDAAEANLFLAEIELDKARAEYNKVDHKPDDNRQKAIALSKLAAAQMKYDSALREMNWYKGEPTELQQAQLDADVELAKALVAQAQRAWDKVKDGPDPDEVRMAELQLSNAEAKLAVSQRSLTEAVITAPTDGTILSVSAQIGQDVTGTFITLADLSQLYLEIFLDETDMDKIDLDYEVEVIFDALPDQVFTGLVVQVDPSLYSSGMISTVKGLVKLDENQTASVDKLLLGMHAAVDVIAGRAENVALVPVEALRELSPGEYAVFVMQDGDLELRFVEVGLTDFTFAEIKSGLEVGEVVTTGIVETQ